MYPVTISRGPSSAHAGRVAMSAARTTRPDDEEDADVLHGVALPLGSGQTSPSLDVYWGWLAGIPSPE